MEGNVGAAPHRPPERSAAEGGSPRSSRFPSASWVSCSLGGPSRSACLARGTGAPRASRLLPEASLTPARLLSGTWRVYGGQSGGDAIETPALPGPAPRTVTLDAPAQGPRQVDAPPRLGVEGCN